MSDQPDYRQQAKSRLAELAEAARNQRAGAGEPPLALAVTRAIQCVDAAEEGDEPHLVSLLDDGGVQLEWSMEAGFAVEVEIRENVIGLLIAPDDQDTYLEITIPLLVAKLTGG